MTTSTHSNLVLTLERKEGARCESLTARSVVPLFLNPSCMTITRYRIIPQVSDEGTTRIPFAAFADIQAIVQDEFDANLILHNHEVAASFHGRPYADLPHYVV